MEVDLPLELDHGSYTTYHGFQRKPWYMDAHSGLTNAQMSCGYTDIQALRGEGHCSTQWLVA